MPISIAFYGERGAYTEEAAMATFGKSARYIPERYISDVFDAVENGAEYGVVPIENSIEGPVTQTYDQLSDFKLHIAGEIILRISHCLITNPGTRLPEIRKVYSLQQALGQCKEYLQKMRVETIPYFDTAGSVKMLKESRIPGAAAIASSRAAKIYGMKVLARGIETNKRNYTRFFIVSKTEPKDRGNKTSIVFTLKSLPGSLFNALDAFAKNRVNLTYIQSRPVLGQPWTYSFYVDFDGDKGDKRVASALKDLKKATNSVKVLGSYKRAEGWLK